MKMIPFFVDEIVIIPHTVSPEAKELLSRPVSIAEFANGEPVSLYELDNGDLRCVKGSQFIEGPEGA